MNIQLGSKERGCGCAGGAAARQPRQGHQGITAKELRTVNLFPGELFAASLATVSSLEYFLLSDMLLAVLHGASLPGVS